MSAIIHIQTVHRRSPAARPAERGTLQEKKLVYYLDPSAAARRSPPLPGICRELLYRWKRRVYERGDILITSSNGHRDRLRQWGITKPIYVVPQGVDTVYYMPDADAGRQLRAQLKTDEKKKIVAFFDDLSRREVTDLYVQTAQSFPDTLFFWMSSARESICMRGLRSSVYAAQDNIISQIDADRDTVRQILQGCDAFLSIDAGSQEEPGILQAMACGAPLVLTGSTLAEDMRCGRAPGFLYGERAETEKILRSALESDTGALRKHARAFARERDILQIRKIKRQIYDLENLEEDDAE